MVLLARLVIMPFALGQWAVVWWYLTYWDLLPRTSPRRYIAWLFAVLGSLGVPFAQMELYRRLAHARHLDGFVHGVIIVETAVSMVLVFYLLVTGKRKRQKPVSGKAA